MVDALLLAVISTVAGSVLNTVRGYLNSEGEAYSVKKLVGAIIPAAFAGIAVAQTMAIDGMTEFGIIFLGVTAGFAVDFTITRAKK